MTLAGLCELDDADGAGLGEQLNGLGTAVRKRDLLVLDVNRLLDPCPPAPAPRSPAVARCRHPVHGEQAELPKKHLVVDAT